MSYKLEQPFTKDERAEFIIQYTNENYTFKIITENDIEQIIWAMAPNEIWDEETQKPIVDPEYEEKQRQKEAQRVGNLKCTKRVLVLMLQQLQYSWKNTIKPLIYANDDAALEWELCVELQRKNPLLNLMGEQLGISSEQIDQLFKYANGEVESLNIGE